MRYLRSRVVTFCISYALWLTLSFSVDWQHLLIGLLVSLFAAFLMGDMFAEQAHKWFSPRRYLWFMIYVFVFTWECFKANLDVARRVLNPHLPINPGIVKVKTILKTESGLTFLANFITLTPGTLSVDVNREEGVLYIHWIDVKTQDVEEASRIIVSKFERILKEVLE
ncbi:MAG: Na+/H+ antiporter subunit E [Candidatus Omnitrophica bacterium]|nr:Na+/H+ antiporter subunit E [Candidatus Omnitrophota bacterium]MDD5512286.1 Na+/H+ antiporter subunit E [Candidatus Omnitrophota bacterium]